MVDEEKLSPEEYRALLDSYGPAAPHSEHRRGQHIKYQLDGFVYTGIISWVCCARELPGGAHIGINYVVFPDVEDRFVDIVFPAQVLE
jgi:hypothetical protein